MNVGGKYFNTLKDVSGITSKIAQATKDSSAWFKGNVGKLQGKFTKNDRQSLLKRFDEMEQPTIGSMMIYFYDAKWKAKLPFWDKFPCIVVVGPTATGFAGLNMHYLAPVLRARLFDALYNTRTSKTLTDSTRMNITYQMLKNASKFKYFKPTYKNYLTEKVFSKIVIVPPTEWQHVLFLPLQQFQKQSVETVWKDSYDKIYK